MGSFFSTNKRPPLIEGQSIASDNPLSPRNPINRFHIQSHAQTPGAPPLKRRRIEPHNDPLPFRPPAHNSVEHFIPTAPSNFAYEFPEPPAPAPTPISTNAVPSVISNQNDPKCPFPTNSTEGPAPTHMYGASTHSQGSLMLPDGNDLNKSNPNNKRPLHGLDAVPKNVSVKVSSKLPKLKQRRYALFLAYCGENYHGMQLNPGVLTIEQLIMSALHSAKVISDYEFEHPSHIKLMRSARTDKGVSAAIQCVSFFASETKEMKNNRSAVVVRLNGFLPNDIRVFSILRCTQNFNARCDCFQRRYEYIFPLRLLGGPNAPKTDSALPAGTDPRLSRLSSILKNYEGSHCFGNFTEGPQVSKDSLRRNMVSVKCVGTMLPPGAGVHYVVIEVLGQSFLLHQIRKMIGLALAVYHGHVPEESIQVALLSDVRFTTPKAPAEGLLLDRLYFDQYNKRFSNVLEVPIGDETFQSLRTGFKMQQIYKRIAEKERYNRVLEVWVKSCKHRMSLKPEEVIELYQNFIKTSKGREEQRKEYVASLYPIKTSVEAFMDSESSEESCCTADSLRKRFEKRFGTKATFLARAPGRVILIGEHLDYNGLPVIGAAIAQGTLVAGCQDPTTEIVVEHLEDTLYAGGRISIGGELEPDPQSDEADVRDRRWLQYMSWGIKALSEAVQTKRHVPGGGRILVSGDLPRAGGLASSSSLVSASVLMAVRMSRRRLPREELASVAVRGEREGTNTRGASVDHIISMCSTKGHLLKVSFVPKIVTENIKWPEGARLFAVDSHLKAEKGIDEVKRLFCLRGAECRLGAAILARRLNIHGWHRVTSPGQLLMQARRTEGLHCSTTADFIELMTNVMPIEETVSLEKVQKELAVSEIELQNRFLIDVDAAEFKVGSRIMHVMREAARVEKFTDVLQNNKLSLSDKIEGLGNIMNDGHQSLQRLFESSVPEVDEIVEKCLLNGAAGSRMTGAGWGGYIINLVESESAADFVTSMSQLVGEDSVIEVSPWSGACVFAIHANYNEGRQSKARET